MGRIALRSYPASPGGALAITLAVRETGPVGAPKPRLLDRVRQAIGARHYSRRTEKAYVHWIKRYIFFHGKRHPVEMGATEVTEFLTSLAVQGKVAAATQNQALSALLFLGAGLRLLECCRLRVKDVDLGTNQIVIRDGKGNKDRVTMLAGHIERVREQHQADLRQGAGWVELPNALARKYRNAGRVHPPTGRQGRRPGRGHRQAGLVPHLPS